MQILDVWTSNPAGLPKKKFAPGVQVRINVRLRIIANPDAQYEAGLWGKALSLPAGRDWNFPLRTRRGHAYAGEYIIGWVETVPLEAMPNTWAGIAVKMGVVGVGISPVYKATFRIGE